MDLGTAIKNIRRSKGIKQNTLAEMCDITPTYLSQIENNVKEPHMSVLKVIAEKLDLPLPVMFFLSLSTDDITPEKREAYKHLVPSINSMISEFFVNTDSIK